MYAEINRAHIAMYICCGDNVLLTKTCCDCEINGTDNYSEFWTGNYSKFFLLHALEA